MRLYVGPNDSGIIPTEYLPLQFIADERQTVDMDAIERDGDMFVPMGGMLE